ncbi:MAG: PhoU domain-containing protein [Desulfurivibrio sp.]|nr:PhoU domain-containing protein [Desulfurivibrio sp.]
MTKFKGLNDNFHFLVLGIESQISHTYAFLRSPESELQNKIIAKDDYIDNLKNIVENDCFEKIISGNGASQQELNTIRAIQTIAVNLERIADFCVNIVKQLPYLDNHKFLHNFDYAKMISEISHGIKLLPQALKEHDLTKALQICKIENKLDEMYKTQFERIMRELKDERRAPGNLITVLFIIRYFERIGDSLLNIGEAVIFSIIGEKIKINQFQALQKSLANSGFSASFSDFDLSMIWGTWSGCRIGKVEEKDNLNKKSQNSIFKEGQLSKIAEEKESLDAWQAIFPSLVPKVFGFDQDLEQDKASMLLELIPGCTLEEIILTADQETLDNALFVFQETLEEVWKATQNKKPRRSTSSGSLWTGRTLCSRSTPF